MSTLNYKQIKSQLTEFGPYQLIFAVIIQCTIISTYVNIQSISFHKTLPIKICLLPTGPEICSAEAYCDLSVPSTVDLINSISNWTAKFNLECNQIFFDYLSSTIFFVSILSSILLGPLSDKLGRLTLFKIELTLSILGFILIILEHSLFTIWLGVFLVSACNHLINLCFVMLHEYLEKKTYSFNMLLQNVLCGVVGLTLSSLVPIFKNVSFILIPIVSLLFLALLSSFFFLVESVDWLAETNSETNTYEIIRIYRKIRQFNGLDSNIEQLHNLIEEKEEKKESISILEVFFERKWLINFVCCCFLYLGVSFTYYMSLINLNFYKKYVSLAEHIFYSSNFFGDLTAFVLVGKMTRKNLIGFASVTSSICLLVLVTFSDSFDEVSKFILFFLFTGAHSTASTVVYLYIPELFPPSIKSTAASYSKFPGKLILSGAPLLFSMNSVFAIISCLYLMNPLVLFQINDVV